ncbi:hypothetical protein [Neorhizobium galegae]|uniref:hypothetical protein n=1 Tax=Neorhizobium galegae TaxID=399 RepID=UPI001F3457AA|nr:hypothetical protein [Neorhizobium galegae]UIK08495.1 hypothetical protein LZK81_23630 [Neorhizobium galegae]
MVSSAEDVFDSLAFMPVSSNFVPDFFTESNQIHSISRLEGQWLTEQAAATIADPRESLAVSSNVVALTKDLTADLRKLLVNSDDIPPELVVGAWIRCADEIMCLQKLSQYSSVAVEIYRIFATLPDRTGRRRQPCGSSTAAGPPLAVTPLRQGLDVLSIPPVEPFVPPPLHCSATSTVNHHPIAVPAY